MKASIPNAIKPAHFFYVKDNGTSLTKEAERFLQEYVEKHGGIIGAPRRKK